MPATPDQIVDALRPALSLVAPVGMSGHDQTVWLLAAATALEDVPLDLLRSGIKHAMTEADHPSKIVRAVMAAVRDDLAQRRRVERFGSANPQPRPIAIEDNTPLPFEQVARMSPDLRRMGLAKGWVTQADFDRAAPRDTRSADAA